MNSVIEKCQIVCDLIYQSLRIPIYLYNENSVLYTPIQERYVFPPYLYIKSLLEQTLPVYYTEYGACFSRLDVHDDKNLYLILGPVMTIPPDDRITSEMFRDYALPTDQRDAFQNFHLQIPTMTHLDFFYHLLSIFYMINGKVITIQDLIPAPTAEEISQTRQRQMENVFQQKEELSFNNSMKLEKQLLSIIKAGDIEGMQNFIKAAPYYHAGVIANTPLRLQKNYFISTITLATRAAIEGGLSEEQAYALSDLYITKAENLSDIQAINTLYLQALNDLTAQVKAGLHAKQYLTFRNTSQTVQACIEYIQKHTHNTLTIQGIADALGYHRSYLSTVFAKVTGIRLNDFIYRCKLEEGRHLLQYSEKTIGEISEVLYFSNQSHFVQRFKSLYGITPAAYRKSQDPE